MPLERHVIEIWLVWEKLEICVGVKVKVGGVGGRESLGIWPGIKPAEPR